MYIFICYKIFKHYFFSIELHPQKTQPHYALELIPTRKEIKPRGGIGVYEESRISRSEI